MLAPLIRDVFDVTRSFVPLTSYPYKGESIPCPLCQTRAASNISRIDRRLKLLPTVACHGCGLLFTNPMPSERELEHYYRRLYRLDYQLVLWPSRRHVAKRRDEAVRRAESIGKQLPAGARILDFGAGSGEFVAAMLARGFDAFGLEPGQSYSSFAQDKLGERMITGRWQDFHPHHRFDAITSFHVFEHLRNPLDALRAAACWLKPEGLLHIDVPDAVGQLQHKGFGSLHFAHVVGFNRYNLEFAAAKAGLVLTEVTAPTCLTFRRPADASAIPDLNALQRAGFALSQRALAEKSIGRAYISHHLGKLRHLSVRL